jgi:hypothetical protein
MSKLSPRVAFGLAALLLAAGCGEGGKEADASGDTTAQFTAAADALAAKMQGGQVPPADDPAVKAYEAESARAIGALGTAALPLDGFKSFETLCGKSAAIVGGYLSAGASGATEGDRAAAMQRNVEQRLDQMFTPLLFSARCSAAHMPFLAKTVGDDVGGEKAAALGQVRAGALGQASGMIEMASDTTLDTPRRRRIAEQLAADADEFALVLSEAQRRELAASTDRMRATLPEDLRGHADRIRSGLTSAPCGPLCRM